MLFVHGIGEQPKDDTLLRFGEPIIQWIERWLEAKGKHLKLNRRVLGENAGADSHYIAEINQRGWEDMHSICLTESWWASEVRPPPFFDLVWWLLLVGIPITLAHAQEGVDNENSWTAIFRFFFLYVPIAFTYQVFLVAIWLLGSLPISKWQDFLSKWLLRLPKTIGDCYVVLHSPLQYRAAVDSVIKDLRQLEPHCEKIMVIAHSQGAKLAYDALKMVGGCIAAKICFISVGSGLKKLIQLRQLDEQLRFKYNSTDSRNGGLSYFFPIAFVSPWIVLFLFGIYDEWLIGTPYFFLSAWILGMWIAIKARGGWEENYGLKVNTWMDIYASSDPVANGPMPAPKDRSDGNHAWPKSKEIVNHRSLLRDHTTYFSNWIAFIPEIVGKMKDFGNIQWLEGDRKDCKCEVRLSRFIKERRKRTVWLNTGFWLNLAFFACVFGLITADIGNWKSVSIWGWLLDLSESIETMSGLPTRIEKSKMFGTAAVLVFFSILIFTVWVSVVTEKTINHQLFRATSSDGSMLVCAFLTAATIIVPAVVWFSIVYPLFGLDAFNNWHYVWVNLLLGVIIVVSSAVIGCCYSNANKEP